MPRAWLLPAATFLALLPLTSGTEAHKPITSPFTYSSDVLPILREQCSRCHAPGGVAPMSLLTYQDAVPWGESMRLELTAGRMPPWRIDRGAERFRHTGALSARELNVLLTWATGGTPPGDAAPEPATAPLAPTWALGTPDTIIDLPEFTLAADEPSHEAEFSIPGTDRERFLRAIDVLPGTPAIVRGATVEVVTAAERGAIADERLLALWVPGDEPAPVEQGALRIPAEASLRVRIRYRRTWSYEGKTIADRSRVGLYFAGAPAPAVQAVTLSPTRPITLPRTLRAVAVFPDANLGDTGVVVTAMRPGGKREELVAFHSRAGWARRYWLRNPLTLPRGTTISVRMSADPPALVPAIPTAAVRSTPASARVTLDLVP